MDEPRSAPYGSWKSPITTDVLVGDSIRLGDPVTDGAGIYWSEGRPAEGGRVVIVRRDTLGQLTDLTPPPVNVRTRVHEYGGGAALVHEGVLFYVNFADQHLYLRRPDGTVTPISHIDTMRYADMVVDSTRNRLIAVREDHTVAGREAVNTIVGLSIADGDERVLVEGDTFYSNPRVSPDGRYLCWLSWRHPNMPWDGTELWVAALHEDGSLGERTRAAGVRKSRFSNRSGPHPDSCISSPSQQLVNLYRLRDNQLEALHPMQAEFGQPQWVFGLTNYGFAAPSRFCAPMRQTERGI